MASPHIKIASDATFDAEVVGSSLPSIVDFWAVWCAPCRALAPLIDQLAEQYAGKVNVFKLNVDENPEAAQRFGVRGIPTVIAFKGKQAVGQVVGAVPKDQLDSLIQKII